MSRRVKVVFAGLAALGMFGTNPNVEACWHRRCCCGMTARSGAGGNNESSYARDSGYDREAGRSSIRSSGDSPPNTSKTSPPATKPSADLAEIDERLSKVEKHLGLSKESSSETESGVVAALAARLGMMVLEDLVAKKFGDAKATPTVIKPVVTKPALSSGSAPITEESLKRIVKASVKDGMLEAVKDANFRKQFNAELNKK